MATRQLASPASARRLFRLNAVAAPIANKLLRLIAPFGPVSVLSSAALVEGAFYDFCTAAVPAFVNGFTGK